VNSKRGEDGGSRRAGLRIGEKITGNCPLSPWGRGKGEGTGNRAVIFSPILMISISILIAMTKAMLR
jgi:hypothetical protein